MAGVGISAQLPKTATGTSAHSMLQVISAAQQRSVWNEISISFDGVTNSATPILVELVRNTTAGTWTTPGPTSPATVRKLNNSDQETVQTTCNMNASAEPSDASDIPWTELVHPQTGLTWQAPYGQEISLMGGTRMSIRVTAAAGVNCVARLKGQE
jgi:hypothetical protein